MTETAHILIVDDNDAHRALVKRAIVKAKLPFQIVEAHSLRSAREVTASATYKFAVVVVDLNLGDGRGTELIRDLRKSTSYRSIPILVLSTSALISDREESMSFGADSYLTKSNDLAKFSAEIAAGVKALLVPTQNTAS